MNLYQEEILDHYKNPHHKNRLSNPTVSVYSLNPTCGDTLGMDLMINNGVIQDVGFWGEGCALSQAAMSMISDEIIGQPATVLGRFEESDILSLLGVSVGPNRKKCAFLSRDVLLKAKVEYEKSQEGKN